MKVEMNPMKLEDLLENSARLGVLAGCAYNLINNQTPVSYAISSIAAFDMIFMGRIRESMKLARKNPLVEKELKRIEGDAAARNYVDSKDKMKEACDWLYSSAVWATGILGGYTLIDAALKNDPIEGKLAGIVLMCGAAIKISHAARKESFYSPED